MGKLNNKLFVKGHDRLKAIEEYMKKLSKFKFVTPYKKGEKVRILRQDISALKHRKNRNGVVRYTNGVNLIYVRPAYCKWEIELYPCEIERIKK
jgi:hypothetical protein